MRRRPTIIRLPQHDGLVREIVERSIAESRERLGADLAAMSAAELRGYVKARTCGIVWMHARRLVAERQLSADCPADVVDQSIERLTHSIAREARLAPVVSLPAAAVPMRAAA